MRKPYLSSTAPAYNPDYSRYEQLKQAWVAEHPKATPEEYTAAMREIAERCGI